MAKAGRKLLSLLLALTILLSLLLTGCGSSDPYCGTWTAVTATAKGVEIQIEEVFPDGLILILEEGKRGSLQIEGEDNLIKWKNEDGILTISDLSGTASGSMEGDVLLLKNFADTGVDITFERE